MHPHEVVAIGSRNLIGWMTQRKTQPCVASRLRASGVLPTTILLAYESNFRLLQSRGLRSSPTFSDPPVSPPERKNW